MRIIGEDKNLTKEEVINKQRTVETIYGIKESLSTQGFDGTFGFRLGTIVANTALANRIDAMPEIMGEVEKNLKEFLNERYGLIVEDESLENAEARYFGAGVGMRGVYKASISGFYQVDTFLIDQERVTLISLLSVPSKSYGEEIKEELEDFLDNQMV